MMTEKPGRPAEGALLHEARKARGMSIERAANAAGYSVSRWRAIEAGYMTIRAGVYTSTIARADTLARMSKAVGVTPEQLEGVGRQDAADQLRAMTETPAEPDEPGVVTVRHLNSLAEVFIVMAEEADEEDLELAYEVAITALRRRGIPVPENPIFPGQDDSSRDR